MFRLRDEELFGSIIVAKRSIDTSMRDGKVRRDVHAGSAVAIVLKKDQATGTLTWGRVAEILTNSPTRGGGRTPTASRCGSRSGQSDGYNRFTSDTVCITRKKIFL